MSKQGKTGTASNALQVTATDCGELVLSVEIDFDWNPGTQNNWIHEVSFSSSGGWIAAQGVLIPPNPGWIFLNSLTRICTGTTYGAGYYWDPPGTGCDNSGNISSFIGTFCSSVFTSCEATSGFFVDGDPSDNWGINCTTTCPKFGFDLTYCSLSTGDIAESISFYLTEDGETGGWYNSDGCVFLLEFPINIIGVGSLLPDESITICKDECTALDAGSGCRMYDWSTGESGRLSRSVHSQIWST